MPTKYPELRNLSLCQAYKFYSAVSPRAQTHTHTHIFLSLCHIKSSSGLFSILIWCAILRHRLTAQAVGIRLRRREASHLQLTMARVRR